MQRNSGPTFQCFKITMAFQRLVSLHSWVKLFLRESKTLRKLHCVYKCKPPSPISSASSPSPGPYSLISRMESQVDVKFDSFSVLGAKHSVPRHVCLHTALAPNTPHSEQIHWLMFVEV
jgi:hypothetical protein